MTHTNRCLNYFKISVKRERKIYDMAKNNCSTIEKIIEEKKQFDIIETSKKTTRIQILSI